MTLLARLNAANPSSGSIDATSTVYRPDIQGLRAVAVVLVVLDHLCGWPHGGFIGVDVFFVISGFLITGLLLREGNRSGRVSIANFYRRRARRILPVSLVVLGSTVTAAYVLLLAGRFHDVVVDAGWSAIFLVNWHLASVGTDYFQSELPPSPLQHYWSLAVEEQFYVVWPILIVVLLVVSTRGRRTMDLPSVVAGFAVLVIGASFAWAMHQSAAAPTVAYFSTFTRVWELGAGALVATGGSVLGRSTPLVRNVMGLAGMVGIIASAFVIDSSSTFPAPIGALPVASACLVIAAGVGVRQVRATWLLTVRPMIYIGTVSYSLYLWHWPVIVLLGSVMETGPAYYVAAVVIMGALTVASYHLIEKPVLDSTFLAPTGPERKNRRGVDPGAGRDTQLVLVGGLAVVLVLMFVAVFNQPAPVLSNNGPAPVLAATAASGQDPLQDAIRDALEAKTFPALTPPLDDIESGTPDEMKPAQNCLGPSSISLDLCNYGDANAAQSAFVVGDSISMSWMPAIRGALEPNGFRVHGSAIANCPFVDADIAILEDPETSARCNASRDQYVDQINESRPSLVIMSDMEYGIERLVTDPGSATAWTKARASIIDRIKPSGARIMILSPDPIGKAASDCATRVATPADCVSSISGTWTSKRNGDMAAAKTTGVTFVDTRSWFCYRDSCPIFVSGILVRWDTGHITTEYGNYLIPRMKDALLAVGQ